MGRIGRIGRIGRVRRAWIRIRQDYGGQAHTIKAEASLRTPKIQSAAVIDRRYKAAGAAIGCILCIHRAIIAWVGKASSAPWVQNEDRKRGVWRAKKPL